MDESALWKACAAVTPLDLQRCGDPDRLEGTVQTESDSIVATTIPYDKGFHVTVDGKRQNYEKVNCAFLGFRITEGKHKINIVYHAPGKRTGAFISLFSFLFLLCFLAVRFVKHIVH